MPISLPKLSAIDRTAWELFANPSGSSTARMKLELSEASHALIFAESISVFFDRCIVGMEHLARIFPSGSDIAQRPPFKPLSIPTIKERALKLLSRHRMRVWSSRNLCLRTSGKKHLSLSLGQHGKSDLLFPERQKKIRSWCCYLFAQELLGCARQLYFQIGHSSMILVSRKHGVSGPKSVRINSCKAMPACASVSPCFFLSNAIVILDE